MENLQVLAIGICAGAMAVELAFWLKRKQKKRRDRIAMERVFSHIHDKLSKIEKERKFSIRVESDAAQPLGVDKLNKLLKEKGVL